MAWIWLQNKNGFLIAFDLDSDNNGQPHEKFHEILGLKAPYTILDHLAGKIYFWKK